MERCGAAERPPHPAFRLVERPVDHVGDPARIPVHEQEIGAVANPDVSWRRREKPECAPVGPIIIVRKEDVRKDRSDHPAPIAVAARVMENWSPDAMKGGRPMARLVYRPARPIGSIGAIGDRLNRWTARIGAVGPIRPAGLNRLDGRPLMVGPALVAVPRGSAMRLLLA